MGKKGGSPSKYDDDLKSEVIKKVQAGKTPEEVSEEYKGHPNPKAIKRWCKKKGVKIPESKKTKKKSKKDEKKKPKRDKKKGKKKGKKGKK